MQDTRTSKVRPNSDVTPIALPQRTTSEWWAQPRASPAIPPHLRSKTSIPASTSVSAFQALFGNVPDEPEEEEEASIDPYEEAVDDTPSSPAAMFLSGLNSPHSAARSNSMSFSSSIPPLVLPPQDEIIAGYRLGSVLGRGGFSVVRRGTSVNSDPSAPVTVTAIKIVRKDNSKPGAEEARVRLANESKIWSGLSHEHILPLFQTVDTPDATYLITLLCPAGSLLDVINSHKADGLEGVGMDDAGMLFRQVVRGLKYLHEVVRLVHGDLKLENVLVDDQGSCRIADFGLARWMQEGSNDQHDTSNGTITAYKDPANLSIHLSLQRPRGQTRRPSRLSQSMHDPSQSTNSGTPLPQYYFPPGSLPYAAPELLIPTKSTQIPPPDPAQDVWALGCVLYALLFGTLPFNDSFEPRLQMKILNGTWKLPANYRTSLPSPRLRNRSRSRSTSRSRSRHPQPSNSKRSTWSRSSSRFKSPTSATFVSGIPDARRSRSKSRGRSTAVTAPAPVSGPSKTIGRVAENVLHGCICKNVDERWTIAMVDEVGWGVGWDLDVDEAGEEFDEELHEEEEVAGPMSASTSASASSIGSGLTASSVEEDAHRDRFGNRFYVPPSLSPVSEVNRLYNETLGMVSSPSGIRSTASELESLSQAKPQGKPGALVVSTQSTKQDDVLVVGSDSGAAPMPDESEKDEMMEKRSRSRGKRGKASRSSSRMDRLTPSPPTTSGAASPCGVPPSVEGDPFQAFRDGYVPPSILPLLPTGSRPSSRGPSRVPSRAPSRERDGGSTTAPSPVATAAAASGARDWPRGRPTNNVNGSSWRVGAASHLHLASSASCPLPTIDSSGRSYEAESPLLPLTPWRRDLGASVSESPSQSPPPATPSDRAMARSPSRGRDGKDTPRRGYHSPQPSRSNLGSSFVVDRAASSHGVVDRGREGRNGPSMEPWNRN